MTAAFARWLTLAICLPIAALSGGSGPGGGGGGGGAHPPNAASIRVADERVPAGATVQAKIELTEPRPIITGNGRLISDFDEVFGVAIHSADGLTVGAAVQDSSGLAIRAVSPNAAFGLAAYPILTIAARVRASAAPGSLIPMTFSGLDWRDPAGNAYVTDFKPGTLTVGGSLSLHNVAPGGGVVPAGTVLRMEGTGFVPTTEIKASPLALSSARYVSPTLMEATVLQSGELQGVRFRAVNRDGERVTYYSYLRASNAGGSSSDLLNRTKPLFGWRTYASASFPGDRSAPGAAVAFQNPSNAQVSVTLTLQDIFGNALASRQIVVDPNACVSRTVAELFGRADGASVAAAAQGRLQMLGLIVDSASGIVYPVPPVAAQ